jgi:hypothetical protein
MSAWTTSPTARSSLNPPNVLHDQLHHLVLISGFGGRPRHWRKMRDTIYGMRDYYDLFFKLIYSYLLFGFDYIN